MTFNIQSNIDQSTVDQAEEEVFQILLAQYRVYYEDWNSRIRPKLRLFGLSIILLGLVLSLSTIAYIKLKYAYSTCVDTSIMQLAIYTVTLLLLGGLFYFMSKQRKSIPNWTMKLASTNFKKIAHTCVKHAKKSVPFTAIYVIDGETIGYYRAQTSNKTHIWTRKLKGYAVHGSLVTLFFRKQTSISPIMVILHETFDQIRPALERQNIEAVPLE